MQVTGSWWMCGLQNGVDVLLPLFHIGRAKQKVIMSLFMSLTAWTEASCGEFCLPMLCIYWEPLVDELLNYLLLVSSETAEGSTKRLPIDGILEKIQFRLLVPNDFIQIRQTDSILFSLKYIWKVDRQKQLTLFRQS